MGTCHNDSNSFGQIAANSMLLVELFLLYDLHCIGLLYMCNVYSLSSLLLIATWPIAYKISII